MNFYKPQWAIILILNLEIAEIFWINTSSKDHRIPEKVIFWHFLRQDLSPTLVKKSSQRFVGLVKKWSQRFFWGLVKKCCQGFLVYDCVWWFFFFGKSLGGIIAASVSVVVFPKRVWGYYRGVGVSAGVSEKSVILK